MTENIGEPLDDFEMEEFLEDSGLGVLGLARDGVAYSIPIAFAYDAPNHRCILRFVMGEDSTKREFLATTEEASLAVYDWESAGEWESVVLAGTLEELDGEDIAGAAAVFADIGEEGALEVFNRPLEEYETAWYALSIAEMTGRGAF